MAESAGAARRPGRSGTASISLAAPQRESAVVDIARQLLSQLLSGHLAPGTRLPSERQLSESLGVGRSTIREALKALDVLGIIDVRQGDGTYLKQSTSSLLPSAIEWGLMLGQPQVLDLIEARRHIEIVIAELAAERAGEEVIAELRHHLEDMRSAADSVAFVEADVAFHLALAQAADNSVLNDILGSIRSLLRVWIRRAIHEAGETETTIAEHAAVLEAVERHSPADAAAAMRAHMDGAGARLQRSLKDD
ncbi:DNA-binding FadR family transcriptional regulator [Thermocatellispora tengchongensis]|uniref:DNA-binding FadR family transcriptional regulator n=1 Tax=Thermocatellispora tengchongensis TaxID=1073253 RepID=A0A840P7I5_9ACTN|nr:FadR/GntR family transcriptional regulator [Thermocatellispora tengchongensis]MBB5135272.1 DNA-binding FadR family transcriptional regulator [Thermocatellispora tengchongensis]